MNMLILNFMQRSRQMANASYGLKRETGLRREYHNFEAFEAIGTDEAF